MKLGYFQGIQEGLRRNTAGLRNFTDVSQADFTAPLHCSSAPYRIQTRISRTHSKVLEIFTESKVGLRGVNLTVQIFCWYSNCFFPCKRPRALWEHTHAIPRSALRPIKSAGEIGMVVRVTARPRASLRDPVFQPTTIQ